MSAQSLATPRAVVSTALSQNCASELDEGCHQSFSERKIYKKAIV